MCLGFSSSVFLSISRFFCMFLVRVPFSFRGRTALPLPFLSIRLNCLIGERKTTHAVLDAEDVVVDTVEPVENTRKITTEFDLGIVQP
jgi:hypothetical protein